MLLINNSFGARKRGTKTIPLKINNEFKLGICTIKENFINFYRIPNLKLFNNNLIFTYSQSIEELSKNTLDINKRKFYYLKYKDKIYSNGFYYSKYYGMKFYSTYFFRDISKTDISKTYGMYIREECNDLEVLDKFLKENNINKNEVLILGNEINSFANTTNSKYFFNNIRYYLVNNVSNDSVSNTFLEALYNKKRIVLINNLAIANDNKAFIEAYSYYGYSNFFNKLDNLNKYCWNNLTKENFRNRAKHINKIFRSSKTFIDFLKEF